MQEGKHKKEEEAVRKDFDEMLLHCLAFSLFALCPIFNTRIPSREVADDSTKSQSGFRPVGNTKNQDRGRHNKSLLFQRSMKVTSMIRKIWNSILVLFRVIPGSYLRREYLLQD